jgi:hypothetical protein
MAMAHYPTHSQDPSEIDIETQSIAIGGKMLTASLTVTELEIFKHTSSKSAFMDEIKTNWHYRLQKAYCKTNYANSQCKMMLHLYQKTFVLGVTLHQMTKLKYLEYTTTNDL